MTVSFRLSTPARYLGRHCSDEPRSLFNIEVAGRRDYWVYPTQPSDPMIMFPQIQVYGVQCHVQLHRSFPTDLKSANRSHSDKLQERVLGSGRRLRIEIRKFRWICSR